MILKKMLSGRGFCPRDVIDYVIGAGLPCDVIDWGGVFGFVTSLIAQWGGDQLFG